MIIRKSKKVSAGIMTCMIAAVMAGCTGKYEQVQVDALENQMVRAVNAKAVSQPVPQPKEPEAGSLETTAAGKPEMVFEEVTDTIYVTGDGVRLRSSADTSVSTNILTSLNKGTSLERTAFNDSWCKVKYQGKDAYIASQFVSTAKPEVAPQASAPAAAGQTAGKQIALDSNWKYAANSAINSGYAVKYESTAANRHGITVCVNAGHGTKGGSGVKTLCHPDGTPKVTGGTTGAGETKAVAVSGGMTFADGTPEHKVTLAMAKVLKDKLLAAGYDVVMIRETEDVQLDNVARTVLANNTSDCHIAVHWDSTTSDKGAFYMAVPDVGSYRAMEPVASTWQKHEALGESMISGLKAAGVKIYSGGSIASDLTQTSYSTVPSAVVELGDKSSDYSAAALDKIGNGLVTGVNQYFGK